MKKFLLVDGNNVMFRAYYATAAIGNLMSNKKGFPTNMIYGFINIFQKIIDGGYTHVAVAFDKGSKTKRHKLYKDYKVGRAETPDELIMQIPYIHKYLECMNVHFFLDEDYEADDIISSIQNRYKNVFDEIDVLSNDNDLFQLISTNSFQLYTKQKETIKYNLETLRQEKGITPNQIPDYKGLIGDKSDNLLGVEGIGPVTAQKLLNEYDSLEGIYENIDLINGKVKERLVKDKDTAFFTKQMAILDPTYDFKIEEDDFKILEPDYDKLKELYTELEFNSFLRKLPKSSIKAEFFYKIVDDPFSLDNIYSKDDINYLTLDLLHENYHTSSTIGFGLSNEYGNFYIPYEVAISSFDFTLFLSDESFKKCVYDYKKIYYVLLKDDIVLNGVIFDSLLASYLINPDLTKDDLSIISNYFGYNDLESDEMIYGKKNKESLPFIEIYSSHIAKKAFTLSMTYEREKKEIEENKQTYLLEEIEIPFSKVLAKMEMIGLKVDTLSLDAFEKNLLKELKNTEEEIYKIANHEFNILSPKQLGIVLFEELGLPSSKKTKTGYSTDQTVLEELSYMHPIIDLILHYRTLSKLEGTYVNGVRTALMESGDGHIHTIYKQALTDTGRLSSTEPNLQNLPIRNKESSEFRKIFIPENDSLFLSSDYSQIELRVLAHMAGEENLIKAFKNNEDIHETTAKRILRKDTVTKEERSSAKAINFGIIYGMSTWGLSKDAKISLQKASDFIKSYHESFPKIEPFRNSLIDFAKENGYVSTIFERRRFIRDIHSPNFHLREFSKRTAMNAPIQGSAADILKYAMVKLDKAIKENMLHARLILTIHDEIVLNVPKNELDRTISLTKEIMENAVKLDVPLICGIGYGKTLYEAK
ncbi:DNA polymerase I [bacterium]|nr:DNA polymerase I [bacterium]